MTILVCCFRNRTDRLLYFHFNSRYGEVEAYVPSGAYTYFNYIKDGKQRVMSAFDEDNNLVEHYAFVPDSQRCFLVRGGGGGGPVQEPDPFTPPPVTTVPI